MKNVTTAWKWCQDSERLGRGYINDAVATIVKDIYLQYYRYFVKDLKVI